jgi:tetratricopeptide (TPR) repeat protein
MFNALGWFHAVMENHDRARAYGQRALAIPETAKDPGFHGNVIEGIGYANHQLGKHKDAIPFYEMALRCYRDAELDLNQARTLERLGDTYLAMKVTGKVADIWAQALQILARLDPAAAAPLRERLDRLPEPAG